MLSLPAAVCLMCMTFTEVYFTYYDLCLTTMLVEHQYGRPASDFEIHMKCEKTATSLTTRFFIAAGREDEIQSYKFD